MKQTILVSAVTSFVTVVMVMFIVHLTKGSGCHGGHGGHMQIEKRMYHGGGHGCMKGEKSHCKGSKGGHGCMKGDKSQCKSGKESCKKSCDGKEVKVEKEIIIEEK